MSRSGRDPPFVAYVYQNDFKEIQKLVKQYPAIETGGDLFGLWEDERTVVIQQFIGPGKKSNRTKTSFHQDTEYLQKVGSLITTEEGLCNVGEWHSHHQIGMPEPSAGDRRTVFSNMPHLGLERFVLFIATIEVQGSSGKKRSHEVNLTDIKLRPFLFLNSSQQMVEGEIRTISGANPHRFSKRIMKEIEDGAEPLYDENGTPTKSEKKKKPEKDDGKPAQNEAKKENERPTLQQQANTRAVKEKRPQTPPRETKPEGDQQREKKWEQTQGGDGLNNENRSPNTGQTVPGGCNYQSPTTSPPISPMSSPQHFGTTDPGGHGNMSPTTSAPVSRQDRNVVERPGHTVRGNGSMSTHPHPSQPSTAGPGSRFNKAGSWDRGTQRQGTSSQPQYPTQAQTRSRDSQRNISPTGGIHSDHRGQRNERYTQQSSQRSAMDRGHGQEDVPYHNAVTRHKSPGTERSHQAQAKDPSGLPVGKMAGEGFF